jgi:hypothetical protein
MEAKERVNTQFKRVLTHSLHDGLRPILQWDEIPMGVFEALFLQMKPCFITNLKLVWNPMLVMSFLVLGIGFLQDIMNLFLDVLDPFKIFVLSIGLN